MLILQRHQCPQSLQPGRPCSPLQYHNVENNGIRIRNEVTEDTKNLVAITEAMEQRMLGVSLLDHVHNQTLRHRSDVNDIVMATSERKIRWAEHIARFADNDVSYHRVPFAGKITVFPTSKEMTYVRGDGRSRTETDGSG